MTLLFRRPFMVESTQRYFVYGGQSDPWQEKFADLDEARSCAFERLLEGRDVMTYKRADNGEWEEFT